jgi:predicted component of type VI protein secretion system
MNDACEPSGQSFPSIARCGKPNAELPADFVPLRLVLLPTGAAIEVLQPEALLGRHSEADIRLPLPDVSRRHCRFVFADAQWHVQDLNSLNGVFVNEKRVQRVVLHPRDTVRLGGFTFEVELLTRARTVPMPSSAPADAKHEQRRAS